MSVSHDRPAAPGRRGPIRAAQNFAGGLLLLAIAGLALWLTRDLSRGTLNSMGPAMLPTWLAYGAGLCGLALLVFGLLKNGETLERWSLRGPVFVIIAILAFAATIRPLSLGPVVIPGLGLVVAGPLAILISGFAAPEGRLRDLVVLALALTAFCMLLFGDMLSLPIPIFPQSLANLFPADWSQKAILRATAAIMVAGAAAIHLLGRRRVSRRVDVATHSEGL